MQEQAVAAGTGKGRSAPSRTSPSESPSLIQKALRLGWHLAELRGRRDPSVLADPEPAPQFHFLDNALRMGDELSPSARVAELEQVITALSGEFGVDPTLEKLDLEEPTLTFIQEVAAGQPAMTASSVLAILNEQLDDDAGRKAAWPAFTSLLYCWDSEIQASLSSESQRLRAAYLLGRGFAEVRWALHSEAGDLESGSWRFLLGQRRRETLIRYLDHLGPDVNPKTASALRTSLQTWGEVATDPAWRAGALPDLVRQSVFWHDLLLGELDPESLVEQDPFLIIEHPYRAWPILGQFRSELILALLSCAGLCAAAWLAGASAKPSVQQATQPAGGPLPLSALVGVASIFGITFAGLSARARSTVRNLYDNLRTGLVTALISDKVMVLPPLPWPPPPAAQGSMVGYAGLRIRLLAAAMDAIVVLQITVVLWVAVLFGMTLQYGADWVRTPGAVATATALVFWLSAVGSLAYFGGFFWGLHRSPAMTRFGLHVVRAEDGGCIGGVRAFARALPLVVPFLLVGVAAGQDVSIAGVYVVVAAAWVLALGLLVAADTGRGPHDRLARTCVVRYTGSRPYWTFMCAGAGRGSLRGLTRSGALGSTRAEPSTNKPRFV